MGPEIISFNDQALELSLRLKKAEAKHNVNLDSEIIDSPIYTPLQRLMALSDWAYIAEDAVMQADLPEDSEELLMLVRALLSRVTARLEIVMNVEHELAIEIVILIRKILKDYKLGGNPMSYCRALIFGRTFTLEDFVREMDIYIEKRMPEDTKVELRAKVAELDIFLALAPIKEKSAA